MDQHTTIVFIAAVIVIVLVAAAGWFYSRQRRSKLLRQRFGPEYDRVVREEGDPRKAEGVLEFRAKRRKSFKIRPLEHTQRAAFADRWTSVQSQFVDDPKRAVTDADQLINEVMAARGYPTSDFDQRSADLSVDYPRVVENYRVAQAIALRHERGQASTEDLRKAMVHYRALFEELLEQTTIAKERLG